jgi:thioredoxin-like negative regulator of GroEL
LATGAPHPPSEGKAYAPEDWPVPGWRPSTPRVTAATFDEVLQLHPAVAVHFWAVWDGHDVTMDRRIRAVQPQFAGRIHFVSCDTDEPENRALCERCDVANIPMLAVFVGGEVRLPVRGLPSPDDLAKELEERLAAPDRPAKRRLFWRK